MVKSREHRLKSKEFGKNIMLNAKKVWLEFDEVIRCDFGLIDNNNEQEVNDRCEIKCDKVIKINERKKKKVDTIKVKGKLEDDK